MATQPHPTPQTPPKPQTPPPAPPAPKPEAAKAEKPPLPIGAKPLDDKDPQAAKFNPATPAPPRWDTPKAKPKETSSDEPPWQPKPALAPQDEKPPAGTYVDGMPIAVEQRARSDWMAAQGEVKTEAAIDERPKSEQPTFDKNALAGGGAYVTPGKQTQVPGVAPPTKRE